MRKTKIICTIGPSSANETILTQMCLAGMNVARLNFSHGSHDEHREKIELIKLVREKLDMPIPIMLDTKGPEYRIKTFKTGSIELKEGARFVFTTEDVEGDETKVSVSFDSLVRDLNVGDRILVNNGLLVFEVKELTDTEAICTTITGGTLSNKKSMSFPNKVMSGPYLSEQDKADLLFGIEHDVDYVAASFVSTKADIVSLRRFLNDNGGAAIDIIAKIENQAGVDNIEEICEACEGIMIARGDLGVEIPFVKVPAVQKQLIDKCRMLGKCVITATEMLESMIQSPRPTRAEVSDVANAVYDGTSAVMLSGESASGKHPVEAVRNMAQICEYTEKHIDYKQRFLKSEFRISNILDAISHATCTMSIDVQAKAIVVCSVTGTTARMVSRFCCPVDIAGLTTDRKVWRKLALNWGVTPRMTELFDSIDVMLRKAKECAQSGLNLKPGDNVVLTAGPIVGVSGKTNTIKVEQI